MSEVLDAAPSTALSVIPASALPTILTAPGAADILSGLAARVAAHDPDVSTKGGEDATRTLAAQIRRDKASLVRMGKALTEGWRKSTKAVNEECNIIEARMDDLWEQVRAPLTAKEEREKARAQAHEDALAVIASFPGRVFLGASSWEIEGLIGELNDLPEREWEEFKARAVKATEFILGSLRASHAAAIKREAEAAELAAEERRAALRAEQKRIAWEAQIAREAAETARLEAEERAAEEAAEAERRAEEERQRLIREAEARAAKAAQALADAEAKALTEREEAERREAAAQANIARMREQKAADDARAERERQEAAERAETARVAAETRAKRDQETAVEAERQRAAAEAAKIQAAADARAADKEHRKRVNNEALADLVAIIRPHVASPEIADTIGKAIVTAAAKDAIAYMPIIYGR